MNRLISAASMAVAAALGVQSASAAETSPKPIERPAVKLTAMSVAQPVNGAQSLSEIEIGYSRYEPAFYTGFAPRIEEAERLHVRLGRGNQVRMTAVLADRTLIDYTRDLAARRDAYRDAVASGVVELTQNDGFAPFLAKLDEVDLDALVDAEADLTEAEVRERNLALMERLNPERVFRISLPLDTLIAAWSAEVKAAGNLNDLTRRMLADAMLPTRLHVRKLTPAQVNNLDALVVLARADADPATLRDGYASLIEDLAPGIYPRVGDRLEFDEFTAIHPVGSWNQYVVHEGRKIPMYPSPGRRAFMTHQRTKTPDHVPTNLAYSYSPWLPYQHVGSRLHNSFHTLWWQMTPRSAEIIPDELSVDDQVDRNGNPHKFLWILSRGPMSSGCTHVNLGHILEMRQMLPTEPADMFDVEVFINKSHLFDVFDIDGDMTPEVMGVEYFVAYSLRNKRPHRLRAPVERTAYYDWLYGGALRLDANGEGYFENVQDARFDGARAKDGERYERIELYEAPLEPQRYQFFAPEPIDYVKELRRAGVARQPGG